MSNEALYAELLGSEAWIITNFSNPFFSKNNFLFWTLLSASLKLNTEGSLVSLGTSIPAIQFYAANRFASRLVAGTKLYQILSTILRKGCSQHQHNTGNIHCLGGSLGYHWINDAATQRQVSAFLRAASRQQSVDSCYSESPGSEATVKAECPYAYW